MARDIFPSMTRPEAVQPFPGVPVTPPELNDPAWRDWRYDPTSPTYPTPPPEWRGQPTGVRGRSGFLVHRGSGLPKYPVAPGSIDPVDESFYRYNAETGFLDPAFPSGSEFEEHRYARGEDADDEEAAKMFGSAITPEEQSWYRQTLPGMSAPALQQMWRELMMRVKP
jgi:hypothetical protein